MPKKRVVASVVGNFSPVKRSTAIFVRRVRHLRGDMGDELNNRAGVCQCRCRLRKGGGGHCTILEDRGAVQLKAELVGVLVFLRIIHFVAQSVTSQWLEDWVDKLRSGTFLKAAGRWESGSFGCSLWVSPYNHCGGSNVHSL